MTGHFEVVACGLICCGFTGARKLAQVRENSNFFRGALRKKGFEVLGDEDSPVMPIMLYNPGKIPAFSRECLKRNVCVSSIPSHFLLISLVGCGHGPWRFN